MGLMVATVTAAGDLAVIRKARQDSTQTWQVAWKRGRKGNFPVRSFVFQRCMKEAGKHVDISRNADGEGVVVCPCH